MNTCRLKTYEFICKKNRILKVLKKIENISNIDTNFYATNKLLIYDIILANKNLVRKSYIFALKHMKRFLNRVVMFLNLLIKFIASFIFYL